MHVGAYCIRPKTNLLQTCKGRTPGRPERKRKKEKYKWKTKNGITLIITIIVMLILVGVTVTVAINGGLFEKSKEAAKGTEIGREKEELTSAIATAYNVETGKVDKNKPTTVAQPYAPDKGEGIGKYTGYTGGTAEQSIPQFETVLKNTCEVLYSNTELGATARSITMDDIDTYLGGSKYKKEEFGGGISKSGGYGYQNVSAIISKFKYDKEANTLTKEDCTIPAKDLTNDVYHYYATTGLIGTKNREILFGKEYEKTYYNWVASRAVYVDSGDAYWCGSGARYAYVATDYDFSYSNGREDKDSLCLRPIVSLPSSVTIEQVSKKDGEVTETWNDPLNEY